ncbi:MAG TPA: tetratricopeptide repeat protein [Thermoanaerobaculia bacterium]|jgi:tetratricopeptide (TPR) repeat protein|nr:tetratricopeptide repeat protein [Thermoanaerobaculia bacterium]
MVVHRSRTHWVPFLALFSFCLPAARAADLDPAVLEGSYRAILGLWAQSDPRAVDELIKFESSVISDLDPRTRESLHKAEQRVISEAAGVDLEVLVPLSILHQEAYRHYTIHGGTGAAQVATHDRTLALDLALLYKKHVDTPAASVLASHLIGRLASVSSDLFQAAKLFQLASEADPKNGAAQLGLATVFEKSGNYVDAVDVLQRMRANDPATPAKYPEATLRLAICLARLDRGTEATKLLAPLAQAPPSPWIGLLAAEELGRVEQEARHPERAEKVLRAALERYPGSARLTLQLASALDARGAQQEARTVLDRLAEIGADAQDDSRYRYNRFSQELFDDADRVVEPAGRQRLALLASSLSPAAALPAAQEGVAR